MTEKMWSGRDIFTTWWPLAASWLFMGSELPLVSAFMARLPDPKLSLAAYGGVVFPIALIIEAPVIMLLATSTALSKDLYSYRKIFKFMMWAGGSTTLVHALLAFTPLFDLVVVELMQIPEEIIELSRTGLRIMLPWTWTIAFRRFQQGVLIRFGHSKAVGVGTTVRLLTNITILSIGLAIGGIQGIVVGTAGIAAGVTAEAIYAGLRVRPVIRDDLAKSATISPILTWQEFFTFYLPLAATSFINLFVQPMGSAAISRMPDALDSLAVWPVLTGFLFMWRSMGYAYNEVVVSKLDESNSINALRNFTWVLTLTATAGLTIFAISPFARIWFENVAGLEPKLVNMAINGLWLAILWPALTILQNYFQGIIVNSKKTIRITISITILVSITTLILISGTRLATYNGLIVGLIAFQFGQLVQIIYLWRVARPILKKKQLSDFEVLTPDRAT